MDIDIVMLSGAHVNAKLEVEDLARLQEVFGKDWIVVTDRMTKQPILVNRANGLKVMPR